MNYTYKTFWQWYSTKPKEIIVDEETETILLFVPNDKELVAHHVTDNEPNGSQNNTAE